MTAVTPTLTRCDLCEIPIAAMPGPMRKLGRAKPPPGRTLGYIIEQRYRAYAICTECIRIVIAAA